jgi:molybdopterin/thiamine biosynthesis adenylyltransferase/rhodanese-related sulfurtransferase
MARSFQELMADTRRAVPEVSLEALKERLEANPTFTLLDVREGEEYRAGHIPGAVSVPRGFLESRIESVAPDRDAPLVLYCAGGTRSLLAARTLQEMGYTRVESANPGFSQWKDRRYPTVVPRALTCEQRERYARHLMLPEVGERGQAALLDAKVLLLGAGGLGSPAALYLAAAGVGTLGVVDPDVVEVSNLQRQILHQTKGVGTPKVDSAEAAIRGLNPDVRVVKFQERLTSANVDRIFAGYDVIVDGCDNFPTRYLVNDASVMKRIPVVHGSIFRFEGQVTTFVPFEGPCYRCLYPEPPPAHLAPSCQEAGVLGVLPGLIGVIQATEAVKLLLKKGDPLAGRLLQYDSLGMKFREFKLRRDPGCPLCGESPSITEYLDYEGFCTR